MAAIVGRVTKEALLRVNPSLYNQQVKNVSFKSFKTMSNGKKAALVAVLTAGGVAATTVGTVFASELIVHPSKMPWSHRGVLQTFDHDSVRRGYEVYKQVCAACHSLEYLCFRHFVGEFMTEAEAKKEAQEALIPDGPNEEGKMFERPGKLSDNLPKPYANPEAARHANNGALPPDLSYIVSARHGGEDYIFSLLTGYYDPPAGIALSEDMHYNPYFPGGAIAMAEALYNEIIEYEDGTPATKSQLAKDVTTFLAWAGDNEHDTRKLMGLKSITLLTIMLGVSYYYKRLKWSTVKSMKLVYREKK